MPRKSRKTKQGEGTIQNLKINIEAIKKTQMRNYIHGKIWVSVQILQTQVSLTEYKKWKRSLRY